VLTQRCALRSFPV